LPHPVDLQTDACVHYLDKITYDKKPESDQSIINALTSLSYSRHNNDDLTSGFQLGYNINTMCLQNIVASISMQYF